MKNSDIIEFSDRQLAEHLAEETTNLTKQRLAHAVSPLDNPMKLRKGRKTVARLQTELRKRQMNASQGNKQ